MLFCDNSKVCFAFPVKLCFNLGMIEEYINNYPTKADFCRAVGIKHQQYLNQIIAGDRPIPPKVCIKLHELHGANLHALRSDIYPDVQ